MDGIAKGLKEVLNNLFPANTTISSSVPPGEPAVCCMYCKRELFIKQITVLGTVKYVLPACPCRIEQYEREEAARERRIRRERMERVYSKSLMNEKLKAASFENFVARKGSELAFHEVRMFANDFVKREKGMMLYGPVGNGKSHLLAAAHHSIDKQGFVTLFLDVPQLFNLAKDTMNKSSRVSLTDIVNAAVSCDLLTLDELGSGSLTEFEFNDILFPILNGRQGKITNFTTNLNLDRLENWFKKDKQGKPLDEDGRIIDRIIGSCEIIENSAQSYRKFLALGPQGE